MSNNDRPGHNYVDISTPTNTLVLSRDEYVRLVPPVIASGTVPPGCYAIAKDGGVRIYPYWDWEIPTAEQMGADTRSDAEIVDELRDALVDAVPPDWRRASH
jgi:asparagine synthetase B (glutamine-hydrolysing)